MTTNGQHAPRSVAAWATALVQGWMRDLLGARAGELVLGRLTWGGVVTALIFVALALLAHIIAAVLVRRPMQTRPSEAADPGSRTHVLKAIGKPLYLLIWLVSAYFVLSTLLLALGSSAAAHGLQTVLRVLLGLGVLGLALWLIHRLTWVLEARLRRWGARSPTRFYSLLAPLIGRSLRMLIPALGVILAVPILPLAGSYRAGIDTGISIMLIVVMALLFFQAVRTLETALLMRFDITAADNLRARKVYTQVHVIGRVIDVAITLVAVATILMLFSVVRQVGTSLLASAGIVGIVAGIAAQKTLANLLAGFQIALAQPMREDDVLVVEGAWGRVEEITLTYVVVHVWDDTRLVLPLSYFIEKPFQNWTRSSAQIMGQVHVWVDYSFPVEEGRKALKEIIESHPKWDRRFWNLQVVEADEKAMQLRILVTAADSSIAWDLRCDVREKFIAFIQQHHPESLPRVRAHLTGGAGENPARA
ncbi:MAG TPA: mechanosensitive ion channel domain-containing protein [Steroidobacteraceae bacterium]|nr:mechanosensitive ion channel domain-containing protein [Steroidobacteraceae bacterium]